MPISRGRNATSLQSRKAIHPSFAQRGLVCRSASI